MSDFFEDDLEFGVVLTRCADGWWHGHFLRSDLSYYCEALGRSTTIVFAVQKFGPVASARSKRFLLTLDAEGIDKGPDVQLTGDWGERNGTAQEKATALHLKRTILPAIMQRSKFQHAVWFIIADGEYEQVADMALMQWLDVPPFSTEDSE